MPEYEIRILDNNMGPNFEKKESYADDAAATIAACDLAAGRPVEVWKDSVCILRASQNVPRGSERAA